MSKSENDSDRCRKKQCRVCFFLAGMLVLFCLERSAGSSEVPGAPPISKVRLLVDGRPADKEMADLINLREGDAFSLEKITGIVKQIYKTGLFSDVQVSRNDEAGVELTFSLTRNLIARRIIFVGEGGISRKKLREGLSDVRQGGFFDEDKLGKALEELKVVLRQEGCYEPEIKASAAKDPNSSSVDISFEIRSWKRFRIKGITFEGEALVPASELKNRMKSREGRDYVPLTLEQDLVRIKEFYSALGYQRAEVGLGREDFDGQEGTVSLSLSVNPQEKIKIVINGAKVPVKLLTPIWEERIFEEWGLAEGEARILGHLRNHGYLFASLTSRIEKTGTEIRAIYDVGPGERYKIQSILFEGLKYFTAARIKSEVGIAEKIPLFSWINGQRLFEVPEEIELLYQANGFPDTRVNLNFIKKGNSVSAVFTIEEGIQQRIKTLTFSGALLLSPEELRTQISSAEGGPFFSPKIQGEIEKLETFYLNRGIRGTKVTSEVQPAGDNLYALAYHISEGAAVRVEKIVIAGNAATRKRIIERELRVREGQPAHHDLILETKRRLENLGVFSEVKIEEIPVSAGVENLVINLREGERNYAGLGVGLETKNEPHTFVLWNNVIRLRGTAEYIRNNLFGTASQLSFVSQFSLKEKRGVIAWEQPYFFGIPMQNSLNAWLEREERTSFTFDRSGISFTAIKPIARHLMLLGTLSWQRTKLVYLSIAESEIDRQFFPYSKTSVSASFLLDRRDDTFNPEKGWFLSSVVEWAYPLFKAESDFLKTFSKYQQYFPLFSRLNFSVTGRLGLGRGRMPIHERFFGGGGNSFRGDGFDELGPKEVRSLMPVGGKAVILLNFELRFPLLQALKDLSGAVFYDTGNVFAARKDFSIVDFRDALGIGVRYRTPLGPVRLELAWNLDEPQRKGKALAFITIGNVF